VAVPTLVLISLYACGGGTNQENSGSRRSDAPTYEVIAGNGSSGHSGDGGPATSAELLIPDDLALAPDGSVYIAESGAIRRVTADGTIDTLAGTGEPSRCLENCGRSGDGGPATEAMVTPTGVAVDSAGNVYFSDLFRATVRRVATSGRIERFAGSGGPGCPSTFQTSAEATSEPLCAPYDVAVDGLGNVLIGGGSDVWIAGRRGGIGHVAGPDFAPTKSTTLGGYPSVVMDLLVVESVLVSDEGDVYVVDTGSDRVVQIAPDGSVETLYSSFGLLDGALDSKGALYVAVGGPRSSVVILRIESDSEAEQIVPIESGLIGSDAQPLDFTFDSQDRLYVAMAAPAQVVRFDITAT